MPKIVALATLYLNCDLGKLEQCKQKRRVIRTRRLNDAGNP